MKPIIKKIKGYKIILIPVQDSQIVYIQSYILSGRLNETRKNSGISHLLEHVLTESWKKCNNDCAKYWGKRGIITNASTGDTTINYYVEGLSENYKELLEYIIKITTDPHIISSRVEKEKYAVKEELKREMNDPGWEIAKKISNIYYNFPGLQNSNNLPLQIQNLKLLNKKNLFQFCKEVYTDKNTLFVVSGKFNMKDVLKIFQKTLLKNKGINKIPRKLLKNINGPETFFIKNKKAEVAEIVVSFMTPIYPWDEMSLYSNIIMDILAGGMNSLLMRRLRTELNLIYNVQVFIETEIIGTLVTIETTGEQENVGQIINVIHDELLKLINGNLNQTQIDRIKDRYIIQQDKLCQNATFWGDFYGSQYINQIYRKNPVIYDYNQRVKLIQDVKKETIIKTCKKLFPLNEMVCVYQSKTKQHF